MWHITCNTFPYFLRLGSEGVLKVFSPRMTERIIQMNHRGVCRTAPATVNKEDTTEQRALPRGFFYMQFKLLRVMSCIYLQFQLPGPLPLLASESDEAAQGGEHSAWTHAATRPQRMAHFLKGWFLVDELYSFLKGWFFLADGFKNFLKGMNGRLVFQKVKRIVLRLIFFLSF